MPITFTTGLKGRTVLDDAGQIVGSVDDILFDAESWQMTSLRVKLRRELAKELGAAGGIFHGSSLDVPREMVRAAGDAVILGVSRTALQTLVKSAEPPAETAGEATEPGLGDPAQLGPH